jgi:hypothetical protein
VGQASTRKKNAAQRRTAVNDRLIRAFSEKIRQYRLFKRGSADGIVEHARVAAQLHKELKRDLGVDPDTITLPEDDAR